MNILNAFDVDHSIDYPDPFMFPFDTYSLNALAFAVEKATNKSVPIIKFATGYRNGDFFVSSSDTQTKSNYTHDSGAGPTTVEVDSNTIRMVAKRSKLARAFTVCLLLINSTLAFGAIYVTLAVVLAHETVDSGVLLLPVTIILTIPALRSLYVGSPPFGIFIGRSQVPRSYSED